MTLLPLDPPATLPTPEESAKIIKSAELASTMGAHPLGHLARVKATAGMIVDMRQVSIVKQTLDGAWDEVFAAKYVGCELAVACTTTQMETGVWRGANIYGGDPGAAWMNEGPYGYLFNKPVTPENYAWFKAGVLRGNQSNGVGRKQLTSSGLLWAADARGGAWRPEQNCAEGDRFFMELIRQSGGLWLAFYHYNGSGPAAQNYANIATSWVSGWRSRLA